MLTEQGVSLVAGLVAYELKKAERADDAWRNATSPIEAFRWNLQEIAAECMYFTQLLEFYRLAVQGKPNNSELATLDELDSIYHDAVKNLLRLGQSSTSAVTVEEIAANARFVRFIMSLQEIKESYNA